MLGLFVRLLTKDPCELTSFSGVSSFEFQEVYYGDF